jgi:hypothetical protein
MMIHEVSHQLPGRVIPDAITCSAGVPKGVNHLEWDQSTFLPFVNVLRRIHLPDSANHAYHSPDHHLRNSHSLLLPLEPARQL